MLECQKSLKNLIFNFMKLLIVVMVVSVSVVFLHGKPHHHHHSSESDETYVRLSSDHDARKRWEAESYHSSSSFVASSAIFSLNDNDTQQTSSSDETTKDNGNTKSLYSTKTGNSHVSWNKFDGILLKYKNSTISDSNKEVKAELFDQDTN